MIHWPDSLAIVAGMPRSGTTFLYHAMSGHPELFLPMRKEVEYFSVNHYRGTAWYESFFRGAESSQRCLDISPGYFLDPAIPSRIKAYCPQVPVVLMVRDAADWVISYYKHYRNLTRSALTLEQFLEEGCTMYVDSVAVPISFEAGSVQRRIEAYIECFGESLLLIPYQLLANDPLSTLELIEQHLAISCYFEEGNFTNRRLNSSNQDINRITVRLMNNKLFTGMAGIFPRSLVMGARRSMEARRDEVKKNEVEKYPLGGETIQHARERFKQDQSYIDALLPSGTAVYGNGARPQAEPMASANTDTTLSR